jgi:hypothetical protein
MRSAGPPVQNNAPKPNRDRNPPALDWEAAVDGLLSADEDEYVDRPPLPAIADGIGE